MKLKCSVRFESIRLACGLALLLGVVSSATQGADAPVADPVGILTSAGAASGFVERHRLLHSLDADTLRRNSARLLAFLDVAEAPPGMEANDFLSLKNDVADLLIAHDIEPSAHLRLSVATIVDDGADFVWRDYCLQKLPDLLTPEGLDPADRAAAAVQIDTLTQSHVPGLTGTALIAARRLAGTPAAELAPTNEVLGRRALDCASNENAWLIDRVTALQIAAQLDHPGASAYAASLLEAGSGEVPAMLRVSALAALGLMADPAYLSLLERHRRSPDVRLRAAARTALNRVAAN